MTHKLLAANAPFHRALSAHQGLSDDGRIGDRAFLPDPARDAGHLSGYDGSKINAHDACSHFASVKKGRPPVGTATITVAEIETETRLSSYSSPSRLNDYHAHIDFTTRPEAEWIDISEDLAVLATITHSVAK